ncbi:SCF ubiquitin ligase complex subunit [Mortierella alpina]|nr:SCF ubiquitin ligase complex subunit [Mortierella alpina]
MHHHMDLDCDHLDRGMDIDIHTLSSTHITTPPTAASSTPGSCPTPPASLSALSPPAASSDMQNMHLYHRCSKALVDPALQHDDASDNVDALSIQSPSPASPHPSSSSLQEQEEHLALHTLHQSSRYPSIPSELILYIFKFLVSPQDLRSAILVCKLWCSCGVDLLWSRPALFSMSLVQKMCKTLDLDRSETVFPYPDYIRRLNFSFLGQDLTDATLVRYSCCTRLERLLLPGCVKTTEEGLKQILEIGQGLYSLDLSDVPAVTDTVLEHVARHCPKLHTLYLAGCAQLTDDSIVRLAARCRSLKRIKLSQCVLLTDRSVLALTQHCPQLMEMDVTNCSLMTNSAIQSVFKALPQVRDINMTLLANLTDQAFASVPLGTGTSPAIASLSYLPSPTLSSSPTVVRFDQLRVLNLTSCVHITDETLARIIPAAPRLRNLTLTKCDRITDVGASIIKVLGKHLHYLHLGHCSRLTDKAITTLAQYCTRIRYLDLACCSKLTDAAVFAMAQLPKLRRIGLVKCSNITDHGIYAILIAQVVPQTLERVHLSYCVHLSDTAVAALVQQCSKLTHLSVTGVPAFMTPRYQKFCRIPPSEFTPHQREVFCVFSGKGVRELRQHMQENPTVTASTMTSIQRSYRIMGSTVASMVAGGQHSSAILAHLGLTLRESDAHPHPSVAQSETGMNLAMATSSAMASAQTTALSSSETGIESSGHSAIGADSLDTVLAAAAPGSSPVGMMVTTATTQEAAEAANLNNVPNMSLQQQEALAFELEQRMEELEQAGQEYAAMMTQQHFLNIHHHHLSQRQQYIQQLQEQALNHAGSGCSTASPDVLSNSSSSASSSSSSTPLETHQRRMCSNGTGQVRGGTGEHGVPYREEKQAVGGIEMDLQVVEIDADEDVRMATPVSMSRSRGQGQGQVVGEGEGSSGGSENGSPAEDDEEEEDDADVEEDVFGDEENDSARRL